MNSITYKIEDFEEPITKKELRTLKKFLGEFTLNTNAGIDIHSTEMVKGVWNGITVKKIRYGE